MFNENVGAVYNAVEFRRQFQSHNVNLPGRMRVGDFAVTGVGPNVAVADGAAYIGSTTAARGQWFARSTTDAGTTAVAVINNPGPGARTDIVTIRVNDSAYSGMANTVVIAIEPGVTVSGFDQAMILAEISVAAGGTTVTSITDRRRFAGTYQGISRVTSATRPAAPEEGDYIYEADTDTTLFYTGAAWRWPPGSTPTFANAAAAVAAIASPTNGMTYWNAALLTLNVYNGTGWLCITPQGAYTATVTGLVSNTGYATNAGPAVSVLTGTKAIVTLWGSQIVHNTSDVYMSFVVSGATTLAAADARSGRALNATGGSINAIIYVTGLTAGINTFTQQDRCNANNYQITTGRSITVVAVP